MSPRLTISLDALRADVGQHGLQRQIVSVHIGNRGKAHVISIGCSAPRCTECCAAHKPLRLARFTERTGTHATIEG